MNATQRVLTRIVLRHKGYITLFIEFLFITDFNNFDSAKTTNFLLLATQKSGMVTNKVKVKIILIITR